MIVAIQEKFAKVRKSLRKKLPNIFFFIFIPAEHLTFYEMCSRGMMIDTKHQVCVREKLKREGEREREMRNWRERISNLPSGRSYNTKRGGFMIMR